MSANPQNQSRRLSKSPISHYHFIPTENIKYEVFLDKIFESKSYDEDKKKKELKLYMQAVETRFNNMCKDLRFKSEKERKKRIKAESIKVNEATDKNELETIFVDCIEEVRKDIMKRRLKTEIQNKKRFKPIDKDSEEAKEFEESLLKLAQLAKNKIKITEFTPIDRCNLLDLFVNNEKTLLKIYEACFPHRTNNFTDPNQSLMNKPTSRTGAKGLSMGEIATTEIKDSYNKTFGLPISNTQGDSSFYGADIESLVGFDIKRNESISKYTNFKQNLNHTVIDSYGGVNENLPTILPTIKQNQKDGSVPTRRFTKPSRELY
mmetsp:Transcript_14583/g.12840  ORF Transcript_14583/g.12840 Transcript_14583/m.12840 type:complete len:320 (-) Transcript_14583:19-978(-)